MIAGYIASGVIFGGYLTSRMIFGSCEVDQFQQNFDLESFYGTWYEMKRQPNFEKGQCVTANYSLLDSGYVQVLNTQLLDTGLDARFGLA